MTKEREAMGARLWLVRHGETGWSRGGRHTSFTDVDLTEEGRRRAEVLGKYLKGKEFARVLASPMKRAMETGQIAGFGAQMQVDKGLMEWNYGEAEGFTTPEMRKKYGESWSVWTAKLGKGQQGPAETVDEVGKRADGVIERATEGVADAGQVLLVAHAHILRILAARWMGLPAKDGQLLALGTGSVSVLGWERETRVIEHWNREFDV